MARELLPLREKTQNNSVTPILSQDIAQLTESSDQFFEPRIRTLTLN